ncbi:MAG: type III secretion system export apparatus subunit SctS [Polyangiales bacterium]
MAMGAELSRLLGESLYLLLLVSAPVLLVSVLVGLVVSLLQAMTQVQDQTLSFVPKLAAVALTLAVAGAWMGGELIRFTQATWAAIPGLFP